jgi:hypothetical protein
MRSVDVLAVGRNRIKIARSLAGAPGISARALVSAPAPSRPRPRISPSDGMRAGPSRVRGCPRKEAIGQLFAVVEEYPRTPDVNRG